MPDSLLQVKGVTKTFPGVLALDNVSFDLKEGEIHALVGENGAGKSTMINVLIGLYQPNGGEILLESRPVAFATPYDAMEKGIAIVPQELNLMPQLTVAENIFMGIPFLKKPFNTVDWKRMFREAQKILDSIGAKLDAKEKPQYMSVANQQFVQIARALALHARIIIFDEPTACLTIQETERLLALIQEFKAKGKSIVFISHHIEEVMEIADRVTIMRDGKTVGVLERGEFTMQKIIAGMVGREIISQKVYRNQSDGECVLEVRGLSRKNEFEDISFQVSKGEIFGIAGLVGAGRTELLTTIFGVRKPERGEIFIKGEAFKQMTPDKAISLGLGYVHEERRKYGIFPVLSIRENITLPILNKFFKRLHIVRKEQEECAESYKKSLSIKASSIETQIRTLSGGNQQKAILARWLATGVDTLMLDEPTRGIDVSSKDEIHRMLRELADQGYTIVVVSSDLPEVINLCDRILIMHEGHMKKIVDDPDITQEQILNIAIS